MTNTVIRPSDTWVNSDGLVVRFGRGAQVDAVVGTPWKQDENQIIIADIDYKRLPTFQGADTTGVIYGDYPNVPVVAGSFIVKCTMIVTTAFVGASGALSIGLVDKTGATTLSNSGLITAANAAVANLTLGATITGTGSLIATTLAATFPAYYLWAAVTGGTFTAGEAKLYLEYMLPDTVKDDYEQ